MFTFRQFIVHDERCGMKVGTDGTLLGAWSPLPSPCTRILDVGTGSGLIALMLAQRCPEAAVDAIDIDADAVAQASENFAASPWSDRLTARLYALQDMPTAENGQYDLVVSNPPFFVDSLKNPDPTRQMARHTDTLSSFDLLSHAARLLREDGVVALILPAEQESPLRRLAVQAALTPILFTRVHTRANKAPKRILIAFQKSSLSPEIPSSLIPEIPLLPYPHSHLCLLGADGSPRSAAYQSLCQDFYL